MTVISGSFSATDRTRDPEEQFAEIRQAVVDSLHQTVDSAKHAALFPSFLVEAIENQVWARPRRLTHNIVPPMSLAEFIKKPYPVGLGTSVDMIEKLIAGDAVAALAWKQVRPQASPHNGDKAVRTANVAIPADLLARVQTMTDAAGISVSDLVACCVGDAVTKWEQVHAAAQGCLRTDPSGDAECRLSREST